MISLNLPSFAAEEEIEKVNMREPVLEA